MTRATPGPKLPIRGGLPLRRSDERASRRKGRGVIARSMRSRRRRHRREHAPFPVQAVLTDFNRSAHHQVLDRREQPLQYTDRSSGAVATANLASSRSATERRLGIRYSQSLLSGRRSTGLPRKSHSKSQRGQVSGDSQLRQATVEAGQVPSEPHRATPSDTREVTGGQGVAGSNPAVPTQVRRLTRCSGSAFGRLGDQDRRQRCLLPRLDRWSSLSPRRRGRLQRFAMADRH